MKTRIIVLIDVELKERFKEYCNERDLTMSQQIRRWIRRAIGGGLDDLFSIDIKPNLLRGEER